MLDYSQMYFPKETKNVIKKDGITRKEFNVNKIIIAVRKSAERVSTPLSDEEENEICRICIEEVDKLIVSDIPISTMHSIVESSLDAVRPDVAKAYKDYRNYKKDFVDMLDDVFKHSQTIMYRGDKENANTDSALVATKRSLVFNYLNKKMYQRFFLTPEEIQATKDGYIYVHDMSARRDTMNCFRRDTKFITEQGIRSFYDFKENDEVIVLTHKGNWKKATVHSYGHQGIQKVTFQRAKGKEIDIYCTPNHRWILKNGKETCNLKIGDKLISAPCIVDFDWTKLSKMEKLLWCIGFALADGSVVNDNNIPTMILRLCGKKNQYASRFEELGYSVTYPKCLNGDGHIRMIDIHSKQLPWMIINKDTVKYLIDGYLCADGNTGNYKNNKFKGVQVSGDLNQYMNDLLNVSGYYVTNRKDLTGTVTNYGIRKKETISYYFNCNQGDRTYFVKNIEEAQLNPNAEVWCLDVEDDHSFILEGGIPTGNCCLFDVKTVLKDGFEMGNVWYNEPKTLDTAFDVIGDVTLSAASQQYGGFTLPEVDKLLAPYAEKSYLKYVEEYSELCDDKSLVEAKAWKKLQKEMEQGFQGWEYKFNTVGSSRGDYPFITITLGLGTDKYEKLASITALNVRKNGQGKAGHKKPVLFPKVVFLYDEKLHWADDAPLHDVFEAGIACSMKTMYPDWLSMSGDGYIASMYKKYGKAISPMGCVKGSEVVTYKINNKLFIESFERMWNRISALKKPIGQNSRDDKNLVVDLSNLNIVIYDTEKGFTKVNKLIRNISSSWMDVNLSNGRRITCTSDHPFETLNRGVVQAKNLKSTDEILINNNSYSEETKVVDENYAWLLGFILCNGCYQNYSIFASIAEKGEDEIEKKFHETFEQYFGLSVKTVLQERGVRGTYKDLRVVGDKQNTISKIILFLTQLFEGVQKVNRHIPNDLFSWNYSAKLAFLAGMIDADGCLFNEKTKKCRKNTVSIGSTNHELALQQMYLAQTLGMPCRMYYNHYSSKKQNIRYKIEFLANDELANYIVCEKKKNRIIFNEEVPTYKTKSNVRNVSPLSMTDYSYDVSTESEHFEVSGIYSHNCRAFLSPWYEKGGMNPADETDEPIFVGRFNMGAVSLHLPMILAKARHEGKDFYEVLDYYLNMIRGIHIRTFEYLGEMKAFTNPLAYCEGGFYGGHLQPGDKIKSLLKPMTASFGITALNELQMLYNGKSIAEDGEFCLEVMKYINEQLNVFKKEDDILYAIYGTPAENLCFDGNTEVQTYSGIKKIKDITPDDLVYSLNEKLNKIELKKVIASHMTQKNAIVCKVVLDNGQEVICTPNHKFAVRKMVKDPVNGKFIDKETIEYVDAICLKEGMRLKSNYLKQDNEGRWLCSSYYCGQKQKIQDINAEYVYGPKPNGYVTHHKNHDKSNNQFENLEYLSGKNHRIEHLKDTIEKYSYTKETMLGENNPFYGKHHTTESLNKNRMAHVGKSVECFDLDGNFINHYDCVQDASRKNGFTEHLIRQACKGNRNNLNYNPHYYKGFNWYYTENCNSSEANHKVVSVEILEQLRDVYDIEVEDNHNFYIGGLDGILVHNCGLQIQQLKQLYGIIEGVSDKPYVSNSFHCHVSEQLTPIEKQDSEYRFWELFNGGKIQYVKYPINYNIKAVKTLIHRAMQMGLYEGVNMSLAYCEDCGHEELEMNVCPVCGSHNLTKIDRMNGYLAYSRVHGDTRLNEAKMAEIADRVSM